MQFKVKKHVIDCDKSPSAWHQWLVKFRGQTVLLLLYVYGTAIARSQDLEEFTAACIRPIHTDRSGATAEASLQDIVAKLQDQWGSTFRAEVVVWRMWANEVTRNLNRSTWESAISEPPPSYIVGLLQPADTPLQGHLANLSRSVSVALDCVNASIAENEQLQHDWEAFGLRLKMQKERLESRKLIVEAFARDIPPPPFPAVTDPLTTLDNIEDAEHDE
ncbi:hypothetical protein AC1031_014064 [Aphanomyces cochlioides]|nr:hypothetical protein AC1031_014064 [Aphanomyces cochlioides]